MIENEIKISLSEYIKNNISDPKLQKYLIEYMKQGELGKIQQPISKYKQHIKRLVSNFTETKFEELNWDKLCKLMGEYKNEKHPETLNDLRKLFSYFYKKKLVKDGYSDYLVENTFILDMNMKGGRVSELFTDLKPYNFYFKEWSNNQRIFLNLYTENNILRNLLRNFLDQIEGNHNSTRLRKFVYFFVKSFNMTSEFKTVKDFNYQLFSKQYRFFKKLESMSESYKSYRLIVTLIQFYTFIHKYIEKNKINHNLFKYGDRIDINFLNRVDFKKLYEEGYSIHYFNKNISISNDIEEEVKDKILVCPNGFEEFSSVLRIDTYVKVDFSNIKDCKLKKFVKQYFQYCDSNNLVSINKSLKNIIPFVNFIEKLQREKKVLFLNREGDISFTPELAMVYKYFLMDKYDNNTTININLAAVRHFTSFLNENNLAKVYQEYFNMLSNLPKEGGRINPIAAEDLEKVILKYKQRKTNGSINEKINWIIFNIVLTTNLRISEIVNIEIKNIDFTNHEILMRRKTSGVEKVPYYASEYIMQLLKTAYKITHEYREKCKKSICDYLFLYKPNNKDISVMNREVFNDSFKRIVKSIDSITKDYVAYDLRDTYMTNIMTGFMKKGKSLWELHEATGHKSLTTTLQHYARLDVKEYIKTFSNLKIGFTEVKGNIAEKVSNLKVDETTLKERMVKNSCGYCSFNDCRAKDNLDCLMCDSFITTKERIPNFQQAIRKVELEIENETDSNEIKALKRLKDLYIAYLVKLQQLV